MDILGFLETAFGWIYFTTWSATFYPQMLLIYRRRKSSGFSIDYMVMNDVGFLSYTLFTFISYALPAARQSYQQQTGSEPQVETNDVFFAGHGAFLCLALTFQLLYYPPHQLPRKPVFIISLLVQLSVFAGIFYAVRFPAYWYSVLRYAGLVKAASSCVKHIPQAVMNFSRKSTVGFSFTMVCLDVVGGLFSLAQQSIRCVRLGSFAPFTSNVPKTLLAVESLMFDFLFMTQHLVLYTDRTDFDVIPKSNKAGEHNLYADMEDPQNEQPLLANQ